MRLGDYEVLGPLGRGGTSSVFRARAPDGREVALKLLTRFGANAQARFERERRLLASLGEAEGFVPLVGWGDSPRGPFIVMPLLRGGTLRDRIDLGPMPAEEAVLLVSTVARALRRAHELGIVHRDMKPENILFDDSGRPLVADLGLARHFEGSTSVALSKTHDFLGTAGYAAPEQMRDARTVGPQADVFALGAILYECLAGRMAFEAPTAVEVLVRAEVGQLDPLPASVPAHVARAVERALARDLATRFRDAGELARALLEPPRRRRWPAFVAAGLVIVAGGTALALAVASSEPPARAAPPAAPPPPARGAKPAPSPSPRTARGDREAKRERDTLGKRAVIRQEAGDLDGALEDAEAYAAAAPGSPDAWTIKASVRLKRGDAAGARDDASKALALDPTWSYAMGVRAEALRRLGDLDGALADANGAVAQDPTAFNLMLRASVRLDRSEPDASLSDATSAIAQAPGMTQAWVIRGSARGMKNDLAGAESDLSKAIELDATKWRTYKLRAQTRMLRGNQAGMRADEDRLLELSVSNPDRELLREVERIRAAR